MAQPGFNQSYDLSSSYTFIEYILVDNDTIIFVGTSPSIDSPHIQSILIGRIDTTGQILQYVTIKDTLEDYLDIGEKLIETADGGYAFTAAILIRNTDAFFKLKKDLTQELLVEFVDTTSLVVFYKDVIQLADGGYLLSGYATRLNHKRDGFVRRIDSQGNTIWLRYYGLPIQEELIFDIIQCSDTTFALCGTTGPDFFDIESLRARIWLIDTAGVVLSNWDSVDSVLISGLFLLSPNADGGIIGFGWTFDGYNDWGDEMEQPTLLKLDEDFNIEWLKRFGPAHSSFSIWHDMKPTPDGNFIGAGRVAPYDVDDLNALLSGWLYKFTPEGDSIWARADRTEIPYESGIDDNYFGGVDFLSTGSVVAGGTSYVNGQFYGWIIKVTLDGCLDTLWCQPVPASEPPAEKAARIWPNPATDHFFLDLPAESGMVQLTLVAPDGRVVHRQSMAQSSRVSVSGLPVGLYYWHVAARNGPLASGKLIVQR